MYVARKILQPHHNSLLFQTGQTRPVVHVQVCVYDDNLLGQLNLLYLRLINSFLNLFFGIESEKT